MLSGLTGGFACWLCYYVRFLCSLLDPIHTGPTLPTLPGVLMWFRNYHAAFVFHVTHSRGTGRVCILLIFTDFISWIWFSRHQCIINFQKRGVWSYVPTFNIAQSWFAHFMHEQKYTHQEKFISWLYMNVHNDFEISGQYMDCCCTSKCKW